VLTAWAHWSGQPKWAWLDQPGPAGCPLTLPSLGHVLTLILSGDPESPTTPSPDSGELRRAPPPPYGAIAPPRRVLPSDRGDSLTSPPFIAIASELRPVDLALEARSASAGLAGASSCLSVLVVVPPSPRRLDGEPATPTSPPRCCAWPLDREHGAASHHRSHWTVASLPQPWLCRRCRRHGLLPRSSVTSPVSSLLLPCLCALVLVVWPASQACLPTVVLPCLSLWCCPRASMLATIYCRC
jgi:hypothetical protein